MGVTGRGEGQGVNTYCLLGGHFVLATSDAGQYE